MSAILFLAALAAAPALADEPCTEAASVAQAEPAQDRNNDAIARLRDSAAVRSRDPAALINLAAAYARIGQKALALDTYRAAIASPDRYDVQLADGRWMDTRALARSGAEALERSDRIVLR